jgi:carboxyl-terminal processing protease
VLNTPSLGLRVLLGVFLATTVVGGDAGPRPAQAAPDISDRVITASRIYSLVQQYFAHWEGVPRADFEAAYRAYVDRAVRADSGKLFTLATLRFLATLKNSHTQFFDAQLDSRPLKFRLLEVEDQWVVIGSQDSRLSRGEVVRSLDGRPVSDFVHESAQYVAASNERLARAHVFSYPGLFPERVSLTLQNGRTVMVDRAVPSDVPEPAPVRDSQGRWLRDGEVAYIRIPSFGDPAYERTAVELVRRFSAAPHLIVDVRGNGGGSTPRPLTAALMNRPWRTWQETGAQHNGLLEAQGVAPLQAVRAARQQAPSQGAYQGRLFLLVDRFCGSACEDFVMPFKDTGRATVVGETTQGSSGNPYRTEVGHGMSIAVGAVRYRFPDGAPFEGIGIVPDVVVERRIADVAAGRDAVLARAESLAAGSR